MDYDFQYPATRRAERDEYRSRFTFPDEEPSKAKSPKNKTDYLIRLILLQCVLCILIAGSIFAVSKISSSAFEVMKTDFKNIMDKDMSAGEVVQEIKDAAQLVMASSGKTAGEENEEKKLVPSLESPVSSYEVISDETGETVAVGEILPEGSGGGDMEDGIAAKGTSFASYSVNADAAVPVKNARITSRFGYRTNPVSGNYGFHTGLDLAAAEGTPIAASFYGEVVETGESDVWGKYVLMRHSESFETYYCHMSEIYVKEGAVIRQGETVGLVGSTGWSTGPHLHFEVRINGIRVDPEILLYPDEA